MSTVRMTREHNRRNAARGRYTPVHARSGRRRGAGRIQQCVKDVLDIASKTEDFAQAKKCIEQLFVVSKAQHRGHLAVAQRVRDQIDRAYDDVLSNAQPCLGQVLEWLDHEHLHNGRSDSKVP